VVLSVIEKKRNKQKIKRCKTKNKETAAPQKKIRGKKRKEMKNQKCVHFLSPSVELYPLLA